MSPVMPRGKSLEDWCLCLGGFSGQCQTASTEWLLSFQIRRYRDKTSASPMATGHRVSSSLVWRVTQVTDIDGTVLCEAGEPRGQ